jgi:hypothetical protein
VKFNFSIDEFIAFAWTIGHDSDEKKVTRSGSINPITCENRKSKL